MRSILTTLIAATVLLTTSTAFAGQRYYELEQEKEQLRYDQNELNARKRVLQNEENARRARIRAEEAREAYFEQFGTYDGYNENYNGNYQPRRYRNDDDNDFSDNGHNGGAAALGIIGLATGIIAGGALNNNNQRPVAVPQYMEEQPDGEVFVPGCGHVSPGQQTICTDGRIVWLDNYGRVTEGGAR